MSRISRGQWAMKLAQLTSQRSTCCRRQVGCVMLNESGHVISTGYNGVAAGLPHCNEEDGAIDTSFDELANHYPFACDGANSPSGTNLDGCQAIHAEQNALLQCKNVYEIHTVYVTTSPCMTCTKLLMNTSCQQIVFVEEYPHAQAKDLWESAGRKWLNYSQL
jgi:dCMP deaminase